VKIKQKGRKDKQRSYFLVNIVAQDYNVQVSLAISCDRKWKAS